MTNFIAPEKTPAQLRVETLEKALDEFVSSIAPMEQISRNAIELWEIAKARALDEPSERARVQGSIDELKKRLHKHERAVPFMRNVLRLAKMQGYADLMEVDDELLPLVTSWPTCRAGTPFSCGRCHWRIFVVESALQEHLEKK